MDFKVQLFALVVVLSINVNYFKNKRLPLRSTRMFTAFLIASVINLAFDIITRYTIRHFNSSFYDLNRLCHQIFIGSLNVIVFFLYRYVEVKANFQKRLPVKEMLVRSIPFALSMVAVVFGNLNYYIGTDGVYSYGIMAEAVYLSAAIYIGMTMYILSKEKGQFTNDAKGSISLGILMWTCIAIYQLLNPLTLITAIAVALMVLYVFLSVENPREFADFETHTLNMRAFHLMLAEISQRKKTYYIINFKIDNINDLQRILGHIELEKVLANVADVLSKITKRRMYHSADNVISVILSAKDNYTEFLDKIVSADFSYTSKSGVAFQPEYHISALECPKYAKSVEEILSIFEYLKTDKNIARQEDKIIIVDEAIVSKNEYLIKVEKLVQNALDNDGFEVYYQPIYSVKEDRFVSAEALIRLKDTEALGFVSPEIFVPIAEKIGVVQKMGNIVFEKVCQFVSEKKLWEYGIEYIEVNLSAIQCIDENLADTLNGYMKLYGIDPKFINLEITETVSIDSKERLDDNMKKLRDLGCSFSMDDFGTGYSNLAQMAKTHYEIIKLDKSLIWSCYLEEDNHEAKILLDNCINMVKQLGLHIVAEGIENSEQVEYLAQKGVDYLQGYYFGKPLSQTAYIAFLDDKNSKRN